MGFRFLLHVINIRIALPIGNEYLERGLNFIKNVYTKQCALTHLDTILLYLNALLVKSYASKIYESAIDNFLKENPDRTAT